jgi:hypothetical protein
MHPPWPMLGNGSVRWLLAGGLLAGLAALVACTAPPPEKTPLVVCEAGQNGCPKEKKNKPGDDDDDDDGAETSESSLTKGQDDPKKTPTPTASATDAGSDSSTSTIAGPNCRALEKCCDALDDARITGSGAQCRRTVDARNETSCRAAHEEYKTPDDYYDPVCF